MAIAHTLGFPRIGANRELKFALEGFWRGDISQSELLAVGRRLREANWRLQPRRRQLSPTWSRPHD